MSRQESLRAALVGRLLAEVDRRGVTIEHIAKRAGYDARTGQRVKNGETCSLETLERLENAMRADILACPCPEGGEERQEPAETGGPISGWEQAAQVLDVSPRTLREHRKRLGDRRKRPWWANADALYFWYDGLVSGESMREAG